MDQKNQKAPVEVLAALESINIKIKKINLELLDIAKIENENERAEKLFDAMRRLDKLSAKNGETND